MAGINRAFATSINENLIKLNIQAGVKCIFISHQQKDKQLCREIAEYLMKANIDVYFDEDDHDLKQYRQDNDPEGVVNCIRKGINNSSHMLCVVSLNTASSLWVPWEVGYAFDKTVLAVLTLKDVAEASLPHYLLTRPIIRGTKTLNVYIEQITGLSQAVLESKNFSKSNAMPNHPLDNVLNWKL